MRVFEAGQRLSRSFYREVLAAVIGVPHSAALLGPGSDVLGYDTERSTDHDWGPRAVVLVDRTQVATVRARIDLALPDTFRGWPVRFGRDGEPSRNHVEVTTLPDWTRGQLGRDPVAQGMDTTHWLVMPQQRILGVVEGAVYADDDDQLSRLRTLLGWYPDDVWWWMLACQWQRLSQEEPFVHRTAEVGDEIGSAIVTARLVRDSMRLALLIDRRYAPYGKWLGTAFSRLADPDGLGRQLAAALSASDLRTREHSLVTAYQCLARRFNGLSPRVDVADVPTAFHDRPARVLRADRFAHAALDQVSDVHLRGLPLIGSVDQVADSTDLLNDPDRCSELRGLYRS